MYIDGNNLAHALGIEPDQEGRELLCRRLQNYTNTTQTPIMVVFDAQHSSNSAVQRDRRDLLTVTYTPAQVTADQYIVKLSKKCRGHMLVTSDRALAKAVKQNRWKVIPSNNFKFHTNTSGAVGFGGQAIPSPNDMDRSIAGNLDPQSSNRLRKLRQRLLRNPSTKNTPGKNHEIR